MGVGRAEITTGDILTLPKVELHVHLEGSIRAETAIALAERHGEDPEQALPLVDGGYPPRFETFQDFVDLYLAVTRQLRSPEDLRTVAADFASQQAEQNVRYTEVTFTAATFARMGWDHSDLWRALREGLAVADTDVRIVLDAVRDVGPESGHATVELAEQALSAGVPVVGLGLAGDEVARGEDEFTMLRDGASSLELGLAVHAGEHGSADNVRRALDVLHADRIGHGIRSVDDPELLQRIIREIVPLEVCPTSNVVLGAAPSLEQHPLSTLWEAGATVVIGSDDPPMFSTSLLDELAIAVRMCDLTHADLASLQRAAARATFTSTEHQAGLLAAIDSWEATTVGT